MDERLLYLDPIYDPDYEIADEAISVNEAMEIGMEIMQPIGIADFRSWVSVELALMGIAKLNYPATVEEAEQYYSGFRNYGAVAQMIYSDRYDAEVIDGQL